MTPALHITNIPRQRHFLAVFFISFMWGTFGVDRMYMGKWGTGIIKLVTLGGLGVWTLIDLILVMSGAMLDKQGRPMLQIAEYKSFANKTVLIFAIVLGIVVLVNGIALIAAVSHLMTQLQGGTFPGLDILKSSGLNQDALQQLGL